MQKEITLEQLCQPLNVEEELSEETVDSLRTQLDELQEKIDDLSSDIENLQTDLENERQRADENHDYGKVMEEKNERLTDRISEVKTWLEELKKDTSIESIIEQLEWVTAEPLDDEEEA